ncbi:amidohydrolase [Pseudomonas sp. LABIM340]|uniref:amidohydrolase n=1 Tax=Pseudomonas sp. LABIM340 TaxID=3156585 RepID=UPI0032AF89F3
MSATIYQNARIYTVDEQRPWASAMLVEDGVITAIGEQADVVAKAPADVRQVDVQGHMMMPGIHDSHTHLVWAAARVLGFQCNLQDPQTLDELAEQLKAYWAGHSAYGWLIGGIYNPLVLNREVLTREWLDNVLPGVPICLHDFSFHNVMANTAALNAAGITRDTPPPPGGYFDKDPVTGELIGIIREAGMAQLYASAPMPPPEGVAYALSHAAELCNRYGITSAQEASANRNFLIAAKTLSDYNRLNLNVFCHIPWGSEMAAGCDRAGQEQVIAERQQYAAPRVHVNGIKVFLDGTSMAPAFSHVPLDPVTDQPITYNLLLDSDELVEKIREWTAAGMILKAHCTGYGSLRIGLDCYERALDVPCKPGQMHDIAHAHYVSPRDRKRFAELGVVAEMSPAIWHMPEYQAALADAYDFKTMHEHGALMTVGTDWLLPPTPNLFPAMAGMLEHRDQSVALDVAVKMMTLNGAIALGQESRWGSLEVGKEATFIILDRNIFESTPAQIADTEVHLTVLQGQVVYEQSV